MNLEESILKEHSAKQATLIARYLAKNTDRLPEFFELLHHGAPKVSQYGSYTLLKITNSRRKKILIPYLEKIYSFTKLEDVHEALTRASYKVFGELTAFVPEDLSGLIYDDAYSISINLKYSLACRSYALQILHNYLKIYPELLPDIEHIVGLLEKDSSPAIISRINHINKTVSRITKKE